MDPLWLLLIVPLVLVAGALAGGYACAVLRERGVARQKALYGNAFQDYEDAEPSPPAPPQVAEMGRVRYGATRPGARRQLRGHRPK